MTGDLDRLRSMLIDARRVVVFTGAGISTESGIPDFRSPGGIWSHTTPIMFEDFVTSVEARRESWRRRVEIERDMVGARPNPGHLAVARLVAAGKVTALITQNIDGLHQASGVPEEKVIELHGNSTYATCLACGERHALDPILDAFRADGTIPQCGACDGIVKTATISFGQPMPAEPMERARAAALSCDLFLAIGSSLVVWPAASFPLLAKQNGAALVILNREATDHDPCANLVLHREIGPTLSAVVEPP